MKAGDMKAVALTKEQHRIYTNAWRDEIAYSNSKKLIKTGKVTRKQIFDAAKKIYRDNPAILRTLGL